MGLLEIFDGTAVYFDTAPVIYNVEGIAPYADLLEPVFRAVQSGSVRACTATLTLAETLVVPYRDKHLALLEKIEELLMGTPDLTLFPLTPEIARETARIRAKSSIKTPDAIQLATARIRGIDYFLTNDKELKHFSMPQVILLDNFV